MEPDETSVYVFLGHSSITCNRTVVPVAGFGRDATVAEVVKTRVPNNVLIVSFGLAGEINPIYVQDILRSMSMAPKYRKWLLDPKRFFDDIRVNVNSRLKHVFGIEVPMYLSEGETLDFKGTPFLYESSNGGSVCKSGLYNLRSLQQFEDPLAFSALKAPIASPETIRDEIFGEGDKRAILPDFDDLKTLSSGDKTLAEWNSEFNEDHFTITTNKLSYLASKTREKIHIFYLPACRVPEFSTNVSSQRAKTRSAESAMEHAILEARAFENSQTKAILSALVYDEKGATELAASEDCAANGCTIAGGSRRKRHRKRRIQKKRRMTRRTRRFYS
jgi:hypothetical protein